MDGQQPVRWTNTTDYTDLYVTHNYGSKIHLVTCSLKKICTHSVVTLKHKTVCSYVYIPHHDSIMPLSVGGMKEFDVKVWCNIHCLKMFSCKMHSQLAEHNWFFRSFFSPADKKWGWSFMKALHEKMLQRTWGSFWLQYVSVDKQQFSLTVVGLTHP